ncbi:outer membrane beta-barrel protein [Sphingomonas rubra]|uniref:Outer membrane protein beta-barrel domain-containing protein n=1 Tax=Sphingomonas rubra TaxID=634430 RepID=A0A1I5U5Z3_9SPHN|nr:outer membrane beta-barrel protein [Sphingomonas rubra]SFP90688.1 Outer membrane protein beta-barrel domain-containing protein [Sphingomonas rubra]
MRWIGATLVAVGTAMPAQAQTFVDLFAGKSFPQRSATTLTAAEARINDTVIPAEVRVDVERLRLSNSTIFGARVGHWFDWFGIAADASTLDPDVKRQTIRATANVRFDEEVFGEEVVIDPGRSVAVDIPRVTIPTTATFAALAMVRVPRGGVEPYAFAGPVYLVTDSDISGDWGVRAGGGAKLPIGRRVALFGEYRYTRVAASAVAGRVGGEARGVTGTTGDIRVDATLRNHSAVGGVSFAF